MSYLSFTTTAVTEVICSEHSLHAGGLTRAHAPTSAAALWDWCNGETEAQRGEVTCPRARIQSQFGFTQNFMLYEPRYNPWEQETRPPKGLACPRALSEPGTEGACN